MHPYDLDKVIRKIPGFPHEGILFYDITGITAVPEAYRWVIDKMVELYQDKGIDSVGCIEARGFIFAAPFAYKMGIPLVLIRKKGKHPGKTREKSYCLEYGADTIAVQEIDVHPGDKVLLVDDLIATGGTFRAAAELLEECGASVAGVFGVIGLPFLNYEDVLSPYEINVLQTYENE
ncbi:MAG: adenine phosphoribosyltransferase [Sphaerochaetaceae bacterium]